MKTVLVSMLQEHGHLNPSFKVNRALSARGYQVKYLGILDFEEHIRAQGFEFVPSFPDLFPRGFIKSIDQLSLLESRRAITQRFNAITERLLAGGGPRATIGEMRPDAIIVDINDAHTAFVAHQLKIPTVAMNVTLPQTKDAGVPPLRTSETFDPSLAGRVRAELSWQRFLAKRRISAMLADRLGMCPPYELARRVAPRFGYSREELDCDTVYMPRFKGTPELILCPEDFDFPRPPMANRYYVESIDFDRKEVDFPWEKLHPDKPLIYCAMGSQRFRPRDVPRFLRSVVAAMALRPNWQMVAALGRHLAPNELQPCPPNVIAVTSAPQLSMLRRAKVMVTHGGLGSVKECIIHGVPMIVFPLAVDQPGNAARVVHHGIGLSGDVRSATGDDVLAMLDRVLGEPGFAARVGEMRVRFERVERAERGADVVERVLERSEPLPTQNASRPASGALH